MKKTPKTKVRHILIIFLAIGLVLNNTGSAMAILIPHNTASVSTYTGATYYITADNLPRKLTAYSRINNYNGTIPSINMKVEAIRNGTVIGSRSLYASEAGSHSMNILNLGTVGDTLRFTFNNAGGGYGLTQHEFTSVSLELVGKIASYTDILPAIEAANAAKTAANNALTQINNPTYGLNALNTKLTNLDTKTNTINTKISDVDTKINNINTQIANLNNKIESSSPVITKVSTATGATASTTGQSPPIIVNASGADKLGLSLDGTDWLDGFDINTGGSISGLSPGVNNIRVRVYDSSVPAEKRKYAYGNILIFGL